VTCGHVPAAETGRLTWTARRSTSLTPFELIWTVIGDTVNLFARLQSMTRELDAAVAIDDTTYRRAGREICAAFVRHADLAIRGRAQPETVHALPL